MLNDCGDSSSTLMGLLQVPPHEVLSPCWSHLVEVIYKVNETILVCTQITVRV